MLIHPIPTNTNIHIKERVSNYYHKAISTKLWRIGRSPSPLYKKHLQKSLFAKSRGWTVQSVGRQGATSSNSRYFANLQTIVLDTLARLVMQQITTNRIRNTGWSSAEKNRHNSSQKIGLCGDDIYYWSSCPGFVVKSYKLPSLLLRRQKLLTTLLPGFGLNKLDKFYQYLGLILFIQSQVRKVLLTNEKVMVGRQGN